ncbi:DUF551 domain-containing protein [Citrobacter freundii]|uniref:DUF551 domain-containing protein n=1 Tax=Citrobacter freundii TaxID=546 RepID=UPI003F8D0696
MTTNHPAHGPVSLERLHQISEILSKASAQSDGGNLGYAMADAVKVIDGAIAAYGAEPVAWLHSDNGIGIPAITRSRNVADSWFSKGWNIKPLYTAPPAPVVPDEKRDDDGSVTSEFDLGWNACRAAMLQAGNSPVTPDGWVPVSERMPDETQPVIVVSDGGVVQRTVYQFCEGVWIDWYEQYDEVAPDAFTHWMQLPSAPHQEVKSE